MLFDEMSRRKDTIRSEVVHHQREMLAASESLQNSIIETHQ